MPGILPMKVIQVGSSTQTRTAQACDRCRSKKIRCDGIRPSCSQCTNVGFECKTSDKLSRRAYPRGYTESLEVRIRQLESEVLELKDLLDEKDEKIDMLSRISANRHTVEDARKHRPPSYHHEETKPVVTPKHSPGTPTTTTTTQDPPTTASTASSSSSSSSTTTDSTPTASHKGETFKVHASPLLLGIENSDSYYMGASSGRPFMETLKRSLQEHGKPCPHFHPEAFLHVQGCPPLTTAAADAAASSYQRAPSRMFTDKAVNVFFQEWAPLFPIIHKPTFLRIYDTYTSDPSRVKNMHSLTQLHLVFAIATLSSRSPDLEQVAACEEQAYACLDTVLGENNMHTLQCLVLAIVYAMIRVDMKQVLRWKGMAVTLAHRLGLHQSQKRYSFGALTTETRKRVFWSLYTVDCFSAANFGLPMLLRDEDIHVEYPVDADDEYITEKGFQPTLPGEYTRISSALAMFRVCRILCRTLGTLYPAAPTYEISLSQMGELQADLDAWYHGLPNHLKLTFIQDKPSTLVTGSRSPILGLIYHYVRVLIHRPALASNFGAKVTPSLMTITASSKNMIQISQLLEERGLSFSLCMNEADVLVQCGMALLYQMLDVPSSSKVFQENERQTQSVSHLLSSLHSNLHLAFESIRTPVTKARDTLAALETEWSDGSSREGQAKMKKQARRRHSGGGGSDSDSGLKKPVSPPPSLDSSASSTSESHDDELPSPATPSHRLSLSECQGMPSFAEAGPAVSKMPLSRPASISSYHRGPDKSQAEVSRRATLANPPPPLSNDMMNGLSSSWNGMPLTDGSWESLLASIEGGRVSLYDAIYGGPALLTPTQLTPTQLTPPQASSQAPPTTAAAQTPAQNIFSADYVLSGQGGAQFSDMSPLTQTLPDLSLSGQGIDAPCTSQGVDPCTSSPATSPHTSSSTSGSMDGGGLFASCLDSSQFLMPGWTTDAAQFNNLLQSINLASAPLPASTAPGQGQDQGQSQGPTVSTHVPVSVASYASSSDGTSPLDFGHSGTNTAMAPLSMDLMDRTSIYGL